MVCIIWDLVVNGVHVQFLSYVSVLFRAFFLYSGTLVIVSRK